MTPANRRAYVEAALRTGKRSQIRFAIAEAHSRDKSLIGITRRLSGIDRAAGGVQCGEMTIIGAAVPGKPLVAVETWRNRLAQARRVHRWLIAEWVPVPGAHGCRVPAELIETGDGDGWADLEVAA